MKKKTTVRIAMIATVVLLIVLVAFIIAGSLRYGFVEGRVLYADNGSYLIILDDTSPIRMSDRSGNGGLFDSLQTGDRIRILHDGILESYPGQTGVYYLKVLEKGSIEDISEDVLRSLAQLGWITLNP